MKNIQRLLFTLSMLFAVSAGAQAMTEGGDDKYKPSVGQEGKDVIWVPTGDELVMNMLKIAKVGPSDLVYDLGAGDGKIAIAAAREFGATAVGIPARIVETTDSQHSFTAYGITPEDLSN